VSSWVIERDSDAYPRSLLDLDPPERPRLLHCAGNPEAVAALDDEAVVTIVGSRRASSYGLRVAERLARDLALAGITVVSGMARGIDGAAHRGALAGGGRTVAVLANGTDVVYPPSNRELYSQILAAGAVVSEHPRGTVARRHSFVERNRIMAALGRVVILVEAAQPSGSLTTADRALRLGRTVGAVPGQVGVRVAEGTNDLLKDGAELIRDARDVLDLLFGVGVSATRPERAPKPRPGPPLDARLSATLELVENGAATVERVALEGAIGAAEAAAALARLELLGYVRADSLGGFTTTGLRRSADPGP
jgi:DNA processing protein